MVRPRLVIQAWSIVAMMAALPLTASPRPMEQQNPCSTSGCSDFCSSPGPECSCWCFQGCWAGEEYRSYTIIGCDQT